MRHRLGALPVRTSALVALSVLGLLLAGRLISGPSTVRARPPATTLALRISFDETRHLLSRVIEAEQT